MCNWGFRKLPNLIATQLPTYYKTLKSALGKFIHILHYFHNFFGQMGLSKQCRPRSDFPCTVCHSICIFWTNFSMERLLCLNSRVITTVVFKNLGLRYLLILESSHARLIISLTLLSSYSSSTNSMYREYIDPGVK